LAVEREGEAAVGDLKLRNTEGFRAAGGGNCFIGGINAVGKGKEIVAQIEGGAGQAEEFQPIMGEAVPGEGDIDALERADGGKGVVGGVEDEVLGGGRLEFVGGVAGGAGTEAVGGEKKGGGVAEAEGGVGEAGSEVVEEESGVGEEELFNRQRNGKAAGPSFAPRPSGGGATEGFRGSEAAEPTAGFIEADLGDPAEEHAWGELEGEGLDLESIAVTDAADFEEAEVQPAGGGYGG
jgi:hypothetical protein